MRLILTKEESEEEIIGKRVNELIKILREMQDKVVDDYRKLLDTPLSAEESIKWHGFKDARDRMELVNAAERMKRINVLTSILNDLVYDAEDPESDFAEFAEHCADGWYDD